MARRPPSLKKSKGKRASNWSHRYRKSASARGYGYEWQVRRNRIMKRDKRLCQPCSRAGITTLAKEVDHIIPRAEGGGEDDNNLQAICVDCHKAKTAREGNRAAKRNKYF